MNDIQAAMLLPQLPRLEELLARREDIARHYETAFSAISLDFPKTLPQVKHARHLFTVWCREGTRDEVLDHLQTSGIGIAVNYRAVHLHRYYRERNSFKPGDFPAAERIGERTVSLPLYPKLTNEEQEYVIEVVSEV